MKCIRSFHGYNNLGGHCQTTIGSWSCKVAKVYNVTDTTCRVDLIIHNFSDSETTIALRFERGDWYVDDFSPTDDGEDDKAYFRRIISEYEKKKK